MAWVRVAWVRVDELFGPGIVGHEARCRQSQSLVPGVDLCVALSGH